MTGAAILVFCAMSFISRPSLAYAAGLEYDEKTRSAVPIPPSESGLATAIATHFKQVSEEPYGLEGALFANDGTLYFCEGSTNRIKRLGANKNIETVAQFGGLMPAGLAFHPDGRLFATVIGKDKGAIYAMKPDGSAKEMVLAPEAGFMPNDLAINSKGGIYFTDFKGNMTEPDGGLYYIAPDLKNVTKVVANVANANGIAISPDEKVLWLGDYGRSVLFRIDLEDDTHFDRIHSTPVYYFIGRGPDGIRTDSDGNAYVAMMSQGRVLVFNPRGLPIGQILLPGREKGNNLYSSSLAIKPDAKDIVVVARDINGLGSNLFKSQAFAKGNLNKTYKNRESK